MLFPFGLRACARTLAENQTFIRVHKPFTIHRRFHKACGTLICCILFTAHSAFAQFTNVINIPPGRLASGESIGSLSQLNVYQNGQVGDFVDIGIRNAANVLVEANFRGGTIGHDLELFSGSQVNVFGGEVGAGLSVYRDSLLAVYGGTIGNNLDAFPGSHVSLFGGTIGKGMSAHQGSQVVIAGGTIGQGFTAHEGSQIHISGGQVGDSLAVSGTTTISGGNVGSNLRVNTGSVLHVSGGSLGSGFTMHPGSQVNIYAAELTVQGKGNSTTPLGETVTISERGTVISGVLEDGTPFSFESQANPGQGDFISPDATLTFTHVSQIPGDYDSDGVVNQGDLDLVLLNWSQELMDPYAVGWRNDLPANVIDQGELNQVLLNWGNSTQTFAPTATAVPEATTMAIMSVALLALGLWRRVTR